MDNKGFVERLEKALNVKGNKELAEALGSSATAISNWRTGYSNPKLEFLLNKIEPKGINLHWLLTGEGMMEKNKESDEPLDKRLKEMEEKVRYLIDRDLNKPEGKVTAVPMYLHSIAAGHPADSTSSIEKHLDLPVYMVKNPAETYAVRAVGDSMTGSGIEEGDILLVDTAIEAQHKNIVIASINGEQTVKKLYIKNDHVSLMPSNGNYDPIEITADMDFRVQGVVTWVIRQTAQ